MESLPCKKMFDGKTAIITGSARGIGREIAIAFARQGANVVINYIHSKDSAYKTADTIGLEGKEPLVIRADVTKRNEVKKLFDNTFSHFGSIDILVNNAGLLEQKPFQEISDYDWDKTLEINLKSTFLCIQEIVPYFKKMNTGCIINIASVGGQTGGDKAPHYAAAKSGVISLTKSFARLLSPIGVRVNAVSPGFIRTDMYYDIISRTPVDDINSSILLGRVGEAAEVAEAVLFLSSDSASYVTGHVLNVNGGLYLGAGS